MAAAVVWQQGEVPEIVQISKMQMRKVLFC